MFTAEQFGANLSFETSKKVSDQLFNLKKITGNFFSIEWQEQVTFGEMMMIYLLVQQTLLECYSASTPKQQYEGRYVTPT